jgi:hypothetical protein
VRMHVVAARVSASGVHVHARGTWPLLCPLPLSRPRPQHPPSPKSCGCALVTVALQVDELREKISLMTGIPSERVSLGYTNRLNAGKNIPKEQESQTTPNPSLVSTRVHGCVITLGLSARARRRVLTARMPLPAVCVGGRQCEHSSEPGAVQFGDSRWLALRGVGRQLRLRSVCVF